MSEPSQGPYDNFGSDGAYPAGSDPWNGEANTVLPSTGFITRGFMAGEKFQIEYLNFFLRNLYLWVAWFQELFTGRIVDDEWTYPTPKARTVWFGLGSAVNNWSNTGWNSGYSSNQIYKFSAAPGVGESFSIYTDPPPGAELTAILVRWQPGVARTSTNRMKVALYDPAGTLLSSATEYDNGGSTLYTHTATLPVAHTVDRSVAGGGYQIKITGGTGGAAVSDSVWGYALVFNDSGPRNG